jgi:hypothetical protein
MNRKMLELGNSQQSRRTQTLHQYNEWELIYEMHLKNAKEAVRAQIYADGAILNQEAIAIRNKAKQDSFAFRQFYQLRRYLMRRLCVLIAIGIAIVAAIGLAQQAPTAGPYKILKTVKVGGDGGFDYVYADSVGRRLYIPRTGAAPRVMVFNLDTLESVGEISKASARGAAVDPKSGHGFSSSKPVVMWDTKTLATIKTIEVEGNPDGILFDPFNDRACRWECRGPAPYPAGQPVGNVLGFPAGTALIPYCFRTQIATNA